MKTIAFHNLGCKVNAYEMDVMQQIAQENGFRVVQFTQKADVYVVNTCTVTNIADRKSRQMLHRAKRMNPDAVVVAVGCYVQTGAEALERDACIDLAIGNNRKSELAGILTAYLKSRGMWEDGQQEDAAGAPLRSSEEGKASRQQKAADPWESAKVIREDLSGSAPCTYEPMTLTSTVSHMRAYIKIQDGCNQFCSYCAIPLARGRVRSRPEREILKEIRGLVENGYREVVLTGIHISSYGRDLRERNGVREASDRRERYSGVEGDPVPADYLAGESEAGAPAPLISLIEEVCRVPGLARVRLSSLEPRIITREFTTRLSALPSLCPHFHLSLQSGCDATLRRMNRRYTTGEYAHSVKLLREAFDDPAVTTDVIVGFPGETEEEFEETAAFLERIQFADLHIFKYSRRSGTRADTMPDQIPEAIKKQRSDRLLALADRMARAFRAKYEAADAEVLFEEYAQIEGVQCLIGHTPDYVRIAVPAEPGSPEGALSAESPIRPGEIARVRPWRSLGRENNGGG